MRGGRLTRRAPRRSPSTASSEPRGARTTGKGYDAAGIGYQHVASRLNEALADGGHVASAEADARKGAYTNAFKKAAAFFGVGRQAYEGSLDDDNVPSDSPVHPEHQSVPADPPRSPTTAA